MIDTQGRGSLQRYQPSHDPVWDKLTDAIVVIEPDSTISYANGSMARMFGCDSAQLVGVNLSALQPERFRARHSAGLTRYLASGIKHLDWNSVAAVGLHASGAEFPIEITFSDLQLNGRRSFVAVIRNVSERSAKEEGLRSEVAHLSAAFESRGTGLLLIGVTDRVLRYNKRLIEMWAAPAELLESGEHAALTEWAWPQLIDETAFLAGLAALKSQPMHESNDLLRFKDGRVFERTSAPHLENGEPVGRLWTFLDVTNRLLAEARQAALHKISEAAHSATDLSDLFRRIHDIVSELLPARNFYVALYDPRSDLLTFPYFVDEVDPTPAPRRVTGDTTLTSQVLRSGQPLLLTPADSLERVPEPGPQYVGTHGIDWLGVPLVTARGTIGVLTVQTYSGATRYSEKDKELLQFVSDQVAAAVERTQAQQAIRESEERFRNVFDQSPVIIFLLDHPQGRFQEVNAAALSAFGLDRETMLGRTLHDLHAWPDAATRDELLQLLERDGAIHNKEIRLLRQTGESFTVLYSASPVTLGGQPYTLNSLQEITERKRAELWHQHYADTLNLISAEAPLGVLLKSLALFAEKQAEQMLCAIRLLSADGKRLKTGAAPSLPLFFVAALENAEISDLADSCGAAAVTGEITIIDDIANDPRWLPWRDLAAAAQLRSCWSHPIRSSRGKVLGVFTIYRRQPALPTERDLELIAQSAGLAALALERIQHNENQRLAKVVFEQSLEGILVTDADGHVSMVNQAIEELTGFSAGELVGLPISVFDQDLGDLSSAAQELELQASGRWKGEVWGRRKSGEAYPMSLSMAAVVDAAGKRTNLISIVTDLSEQKIQAARIEQLAFYDPLTGLPNRALFLDRLEQTLANCRRNGSNGAMFFLDLDRFKEINDGHGHSAGDSVLEQVASRFRSACRVGETLARLGGDEFVLIAEGADEIDAIRIANRLIASLDLPVHIADYRHVVGVSIGIAFYPSDADTSADLIKRTDTAMYRAKRSGGGFRLYESAMGAQLDKRLSIAKNLRQAIDNDELELHLQPQVDLADGKLIGAEALLRWNRGSEGWVSPAEFILIAEERGLMVPIGAWVFRHACQLLRQWQLNGTPLAGRLAVNVSAQQLDHPDFVSQLLSTVHAAGLSPAAFDIELTESTMMVDPERGMEILGSLRSAGFSLSIDDFGTGYSSLAYLKRFAADHIKIDISFVCNMLADANDHAIVTTIIAMARSLGLRTIAEGVETEAQAQELLRLGCDSAQGYYFGKPVDPAAFVARWLNPR